MSINNPVPPHRQGWLFPAHATFNRCDQHKQTAITFVTKHLDSGVLVQYSTWYPQATTAFSEALEGPAVPRIVIARDCVLFSTGIATLCHKVTHTRLFETTPCGRFLFHAVRTSRIGNRGFAAMALSDGKHEARDRNSQLMVWREMLELAAKKEGILKRVCSMTRVPVADNLDRVSCAGLPGST